MKSIFIIFLSAFIFLTVNAKDHFAESANEAILFLTRANAGDKIILKDGSYKDAIIKFHNEKGTAERPIIFTAEHAGKVFFEGNSTLSFSGNYIVVQNFVWQNGGLDLRTKSVIEFKTGSEKLAQHCVLKGCILDNYNNKDLSVDNKWISLYGEYNTVTRCLLKNKQNLGATLTVWLSDGVAAHHTISYNYFLSRQNGPQSDNGLESIRIGDSKTSFTNAHCTVAFNRFEECDGEIEIISNKSCHNSYLHNTFINSDGGLTLRHGNHCLVDGNVFDGAQKKLSYGTRFIGEGHVAINNYFYHLNGAPNHTFRAPVTLVNGLINTPINGYFPVRHAVIADNIFVDCATPHIRIGAFSNREGMELAPDSVLIKNNLFFDDTGKGGDVYEELTPPSHVIMVANKVVGEYLKPAGSMEKNSAKGSKRDGFDWIKDGKGNIIASVESKASITDNKNAGADWVEPSVAKEAAKRKYTFITPQEVGPAWMR